MSSKVGSKRWDKICNAYNGLKLVQWYNRHFLLIEFGLSLVVTAGFLLAWNDSSNRRAITGLFPGNMEATFNTVAQIGGGLLGFALASSGILVGVCHQTELRYVRSSKHYSDLRHILTQTTWGTGALTIMALLTAGSARSSETSGLLIGALAWTIAFSVARLARAIWIVDRIIAIMGEP